VIVDTQIATEELRVVLGAHRYAVASLWNRVPLGHISQLAVDRAGRVYAFQRTGSPIIVLGPEGDLVDSWGTGQINDPHGIFIDADDRVLLVDRDAHQVMIFDTDGELRATLGERHHPRFGLPFNHPTDVAVAPSGEIYVCDGYGNAHVHCFSANGEHRFSWGGIGAGPGQFSTPHGIWVMADGRCWSPIASTTAFRYSRLTPPISLLVLFLASAVLLYFVELPRPATPVLAGGAGRCARSPWSRRSSRRRWRR
jgi:hypothetical protein